MNEDSRRSQLVALDEELLKGGVILSEWCSFIVREADAAFAGGAYLTSILTAVSGIETYLRSEHSTTGRERLVDLINRATLESVLKDDLHVLRRYRNKWVHVDAPWNDARLLSQPEEIERELELMAFFAAHVLRRTIYENQWIQRGGSAVGQTCMDCGDSVGLNWVGVIQEFTNHTMEAPPFC